MEIKSLILYFLFLVLVSGQGGVHKSYDWRLDGKLQEWPKYTSIVPYKRHAAPATHPVVDGPGPYQDGSAPYEHRSGPYRDTSAPYHDASGPYHDAAGPYHDTSGPYHDDSRPYPDDSYSAEYHGSLPYKYPTHGDVDQSISTYEQYDNSPPEELNMTIARIGGFAGSGDTRGYGAYDFPKNNHHHQEIHPERPKLQTELTDLLRIGRNHHSGYHNPDPMLMHPIPPPL